MSVLYIFIFIVALMGSFFFAGAETGFISWNTLKVKNNAQSGHIVAKWAMFLTYRKEQVLTMLLIGNNVFIVLASLSFVYLFTSIDQRYNLNLSQIPSPETWFLSPLLVIFSEMLPKSLFRIYSFRLTMKTIPFLMVFYWITLPVTTVFTMLNTFLGKKEKTVDAYSTSLRKDIVLIAKEGSKHGAIFESANKVIKNILQLKEKKIGEIEPEHCGDCEHGKGKNKITVSHTISQISNERFLSNEESLLVFDKDGSGVAGWISLLDIAKAHDDDKIESIAHPLPQIDYDTHLLQLFTEKKDLLSPFFKIKNTSDKVVSGYSLFNQIFKGNTTDWHRNYSKNPV